VEDLEVGGAVLLVRCRSLPVEEAVVPEYVEDPADTRLYRVPVPPDGTAEFGVDQRDAVVGRGTRQLAARSFLVQDVLRAKDPCQFETLVVQTVPAPAPHAHLVYHTARRTLVQVQTDVRAFDAALVGESRETFAARTFAVARKGAV
jgi:hypothetical protein